MQGREGREGREGGMGGRERGDGAPWGGGGVRRRQVRVQGSRVRQCQGFMPIFSHTHSMIVNIGRTVRPGMGNGSGKRKRKRKRGEGSARVGHRGKKGDCSMCNAQSALTS